MNLVRAILAGLGVLTIGVAPTEAQMLSPWEFNPGQGIVNLPSGVLSRKGGERLVLVYNYASIPAKLDGGWKPVPLDNAGKIAYGSSASSIIPYSNYDKFTQVDFTYFRAYLDVPKGYTVNEASVTIGQVDDQARMILFNSKHIDGYFREANEGKRGGAAVKTDFTAELVPGEVNTFVIVQVDDNPRGNTLTGGITVSLNKAEVKPDLAFATKQPNFTKQPGYAKINLTAKGNTKAAPDGEFILTPNQPNQAGAVWTDAEIDWSNSFTIRADIYLGTNDHGADGMAMVFQDLGSDQLGQGGGLGYAGIKPSLAIEFDTFNNWQYNDPGGDHVAARTDGNAKHTAGDAKTVPDLEDGKYHAIEFVWNAGTQKFDLKLDGNALFTAATFPKTSFNGKKVYFGFTAATGGSFNEHKVKNISISK